MIDYDFEQGTAKDAPMTPKEASLYTGFSVATLKRWRRKKKQPVYYNLGKRVYYNQDELDSFLQSTFCPKERF